MDNVFFDDFSAEIQGGYPVNWRVERNCEQPNLLGRVEDTEFSILFAGNKHIPRTPTLHNFSLEFTCAGDTFFSPMSLLIFFRYDSNLRTGLCVKYTWGVCGGKTHYSQEEMPQYNAGLYRYHGRREQSKFVKLCYCTTEGFIDNLAVPREFELKVNEHSLTLKHSGKIVLGCSDLPEVPVSGCIAFDRNPGNCRTVLKDVSIKSDDALPVRQELYSEIHAEFPTQVNGMLSPFVYHISSAEWAGVKLLNLRLTGGPSKKPIYPDIDRHRFNEKLIAPYVRIEQVDGNSLGKFYIFRGSVGLSAYHWNKTCTVMLPSDAECPLEREVRLDVLPQDARFFIGYEEYTGEDSLTLAGGPSEALIDANGQVEYAGKPLLPGAFNLQLLPACNRKIPGLIPKDIPMYQSARTFAERNFFYFESEPAETEVRIHCRVEENISSSLTVSATLENVFKEPLTKPQTYTLQDAAIPSGFKDTGVKVFVCPVVFKGLKNGVYHVLIELFAGGLKIREIRRALEVMADGPEAPCPPLASGLPKLYPNILSGIASNHFHPWSPATVDIVHYNSGGNNYFKVAGERRVWELLHIYRREWICIPECGGIPIFQEKGIEKNADLIAHADACTYTMLRNDLWAIGNYSNPIILNALREFVSRDDFIPSESGALSRGSLMGQDPARGISEEQFMDLTETHWKSWIMYFAGVIMDKLLSGNSGDYMKIKTINPDCEPCQIASVYPPYASAYKSGYFTFYFGINLRAGVERWMPGPNGFEDYPYSSGYPIAKGIYQLASCKLECPGMNLYPEMFAVNGETLDSRVVYAHPPYGRSDPPPGFLTKQFYEYAFATVWFSRQRFHFWNDHGYSLKTWDNENYDELLKAYSFISRVKPAKPLRTGAFAFSLASCMKHPDRFERDEDALHGGHMMNTSEESVAFAYEQARESGLQAGFVFRLEDAESLDPSDLGVLVLPPLCGVSKEELNAIRSLHTRGINLVCFEDCTGLEDLFGVLPAADRQGVQITAISVTSTGKKIFPELAGLQEKSSHPLSRCAYTVNGAEVLLEGNNNAPALVINSTKYGMTAFFTIPPTIVRRSQARVPSYGQESISELINRAMASVMRKLSNNFVDTTAGKTIAFQDEHGNAHIIVEEDAWPYPGRSIMPVLTIRKPGIIASKIHCTHEYTILNIQKNCAKIMLQLNVNEIARIELSV